MSTAAKYTKRSRFGELGFAQALDNDDMQTCISQLPAGRASGPVVVSDPIVVGKRLVSGPISFFSNLAIKFGYQ